MLTKFLDSDKIRKSLECDREKMVFENWTEYIVPYKSNMHYIINKMHINNEQKVTKNNNVTNTVPGVS